MFSTRATSWVPIAGMLLLVAGGLGWLLIEYARVPESALMLPNVPGVKIEWFEDTSGEATHAEIVALPADRWHPLVAGRTTLFSSPTVPIWARFTLRNASDQTVNAVLANADYFIDRVSVWSRETGAENWQQEVSGESLRSGDRAIWGREIALPVRVPAHGETWVYVRSSDYFFSKLQLVWWPDKGEFFVAQARGMLADGFYFGLLLALFGYNLMLWLRLRLSDIGFYVLYLGMGVVFMGFARAVPALGGWSVDSPRLETCLEVSLMLSGCFLAQFSRVFLETKSRFPRADLFVRGLMVALLVIAVGSLATTSLRVVDWLRICVIAVGFTHLALFSLAVGTWRRGSPQARFFVPAFGCLFAATVPVTIVWLIESVFGTPPMMFLMIGSALEMMLLSLATADRFAQAQREKAIAQENLIEETEQRRAIQEAYADELAVEVRERTREIEEANTDKDRMIGVIGHDLRSPLTSLTQTAELLASTPSDAAELRNFARDSAQVGRQTLLLIEDLVLWARLRAGVRQPPAKHEVRSLVAPVVALHRAFAGQRGIELAVVVPEAVRISVDLVLGQTLLRNLVANALKFARKRVVVSAVQAGDGVRITVSDDGTGLPAGVLAALTQENPVFANSESGLGLRLCLEISRVLSTRLEVASDPRSGTRFQFLLPAASGGATTS